jgi:hypothetical protein
VGLVYAHRSTGEVQVAFAIGGVLSAEHEREFAIHGGPRKMGFVRAMEQSVVGDRMRRKLGKAVLDCLPDEDAFRAARAAEAAAIAETRPLRPLVEGLSARARQTDGAARALAAAEERLLLARRAIDDFDLRPLACFEQLSERKLNLVIETALEPRADKVRSYDPFAELSGRAGRDRLVLRRRPDDGLYFLIQDDDLAVISNRPFLGERSRRTGFMRVAGFVTRRKNLVARIRAIAEEGREVRGRRP